MMKRIKKENESDDKDKNPSSPGPHGSLQNGQGSTVIPSSMPMILGEQQPSTSTNVDVAEYLRMHHNNLLVIYNTLINNHQLSMSNHQLSMSQLSQVLSMLTLCSGHQGGQKDIDIIIVSTEMQQRLGKHLFEKKNVDATAIRIPLLSGFYSVPPSTIGVFHSGKTLEILPEGKRVYVYSDLSPSFVLYDEEEDMKNLSVVLVPSGFMLIIRTGANEQNMFGVTFNTAEQRCYAYEKLLALKK